MEIEKMFNFATWEKGALECKITLEKKKKLTILKYNIMVIQRWQSVLLLVAAVMMGLFSFCTLGTVNSLGLGQIFSFTAMGFAQIGSDAPELVSYSTWYLFVLSLTTMVLLLIDIFLYRNLPLQKKVCLVSVLFIIATSVTAGALGYGALPEGEIDWSQMVCAPIIALIATVMAYQRMVKDHNMLKSVDRIR